MAKGLDELPGLNVPRARTSPNRYTVEHGFQVHACQVDALAFARD